MCLAVKQASSGPSKRGERSDDSNWLQLPLLGFGPFLGLASNASQGCHPADSNRWPFGTCTLLASQKQAKAASAAEGEQLPIRRKHIVTAACCAAAAVSIRSWMYVQALHSCYLLPFGCNSA
jgi:hypothetical protein